jgi:hypothetical protein
LPPEHRSLPKCEGTVQSGRHLAVIREKREPPGLPSLSLVSRDSCSGRAARAEARVWDAGARPETITVNIDVTLLTAHSEKELAAGNYRTGTGSIR